MAEETKPKTKSVAKYYRHRKLNQFQSIMSGSNLGKMLHKSPSWEELSRAEFLKRQGITEKVV